MERSRTEEQEGRTEGMGRIQRRKEEVEHVFFPHFSQEGLSNVVLIPGGETS